MISRRPGEVTSANASQHDVRGQGVVPAQEGLDGRQGEGCVLRLVGSVEREEHLLVAAAQPLQPDHLATDGGHPAGDPELQPLAGQRGARPRCTARRSPAITSGDCTALMTVAPGLMMPTFSRAMIAGDSPRYFAWSTAIGREHGHVRVHHVGRVPGAAHADLDDGGVDRGIREGGVRHGRRRSRRRTAGGRAPASTRWVYGATSLKAVTNASSSIGSPSRLIRSVIDSRCGLVNRPTRSPRVAISVSTIRAVEVLPLVPVRWIDRVGALGVAEQLHERLDAVQRGVELGLRPPAQQRVLDLGIGLGQSRIGAGVSRRIWSGGVEARGGVHRG